MCLTKHYDIHSLRLTVTAQGRPLLEAVDTALHSYQACDAGSPSAGDFHLEMRYGTPFPPPPTQDMNTFWEGTLPGGVPIVFRCAPGLRQIEVTGLAWARMDLQARHAAITAAEGAEPCILEACILPILYDFLGQVGHHVVHGASLFVDIADRRRAIVISGPSGTGKTTAALALAAAGMGLLADDMSVYSPAGDGAIWGVQFHSKILPRTLELLPWLNRFPRNDTGRDGEMLLDSRAIGRPTAGMTASPAVIIFLSARNAWRHEIKPLDKSQAVIRLTKDNVRAHETHHDGGGAAAFKAMACLVRQSDTYEASLCPRVHELYGLIRSLVK